MESNEKELILKGFNNIVNTVKRVNEGIDNINYYEDSKKIYLIADVELKNKRKIIGINTKIKLREANEYGINEIKLYVNKILNAYTEKVERNKAIAN